MESNLDWNTAGDGAGAAIVPGKAGNKPASFFLPFLQVSDDMGGFIQLTS
jgi:hypothetical protein